MTTDYRALAAQDAKAAGIDPTYFVNQIQAESGFNPNAISSAGAEGIAQFMPGTAAGLGINPYNPVQALQGAANLMASYIKQYGGSEAKALAAYNAGPGNVSSSANWESMLPLETRNYIANIMGNNTSASGLTSTTPTSSTTATASTPSGISGIIQTILGNLNVQLDPGTLASSAVILPVGIIIIIIGLLALVWPTVKANIQVIGASAMRGA